MGDAVYHEKAGVYVTPVTTPADIVLSREIYEIVRMIDEIRAAGGRIVVVEARRAGRPRIGVDLERAEALVREGVGLRKVAREVGVSVGTLRRRLRGVG